MRFTVLFLLISSSYLLGQSPTNDECTNAIDIGAVSDCQNVFYSNVGATTSDIGDNNLPDCFVGPATERDVWFVFTSTEALTNILIDVEGSLSGDNTKSIVNPQVALYKGSCDALELVGCASEQTNLTGVRLISSNLTPGIEYYIRVNNIGADIDSNDGDFTLCIEPRSSIFQMGETTTSSSDCSGRLFDSGGPSGNYKNNENNTFTVCPEITHSCLSIDVRSFNISDFDELNIYAGDDVNAPLVAKLSGVSLTSEFNVLAESECVTFQFLSDNLGTASGFELAWTCREEPCGGNALNNPEEITGLPFSANGATTCGSGSTFASSPCFNAGFINGPEYIYSFISSGGSCIGIDVINAAPGTGVLVLDGLPDNPATRCVAFNGTGSINSADTRTPGTYYIIVANAAGCTDFDLIIEEKDCNISPALVDALCNPINSCITNPNDTFTVFIENGFKDIELDPGSNGGCWIDDGAEPDYFWFSVQAAATGDLGFTVAAAGAPSDIDFNVWGPFSEDMV